MYSRVRRCRLKFYISRWSSDAARAAGADRSGLALHGPSVQMKRKPLRRFYVNVVYLFNQIDIEIEIRRSASQTYQIVTAVNEMDA
ncbi:hypothetical protein NDU88_003466 [Pleurodeles waltl]|uniref:Uncharacterized protein n=1 Tax=Pleurodeles waltl TaxID=8319 RepID=A0AAV7SG86_PLEWA|nr:hypothetical protein NDU88_003466 [Pleurodeles waltl]